ncbi:membrane protein insertion efficiency factor YidD [Moraxella haemolytica]|uniref:membrane protein insertion efficiency factor YidD n=1 Tax=Moraxella TaxID=475 RepID=UPI0025433FAF|nr:membrane protein insertion efficiency factor YidD [Moraxella sp. ZY171148]WII95289.1 membrane protein insertion efficiency factor YidD [Moraxella sp. ZY171148]
MIKKVLIGLIWFYQKAISPLMSARCRYYPSCSHYGRWAILWHGTWAGLPLVAKRILSCHPLGGSGIDFVPVPMSVYHYRYVGSKSNHSGIGVFTDDFDYVGRLNHLMRTT